MEELHLTKKDFRLEWFSGQGAGGQHRNKHQNCCRITHVESGLSCVGQNSRSRVTNQTEAFNSLVRLLLAKMMIKKTRRETTEVVRNYHGVRNEVHDKKSGLKLPYKDVVEGCDLEPMISARRKEFTEF